jgi:hypothetical protein
MTEERDDRDVGRGTWDVGGEGQSPRPDEIAATGETPEELAAAHAGIHLPKPTIWPFVVGLGIAVVAFGFVTSWWFAGLGIVVLVVGVAGWIGDLLHESA